MAASLSGPTAISNSSSAWTRRSKPSWAQRCSSSESTGPSDEDESADSCAMARSRSRSVEVRLDRAPGCASVCRARLEPWRVGMSASKSKGQSRGGEARGNRWDLAGGIWAEVRAARALSTAGSTRKPKGKSCLGARGQCRTAPGPVGNAAGARGRALLFAAVMSAARARCPLAGVHGGVVCCRGQALCKEARHGSDARQVGSRTGDCRRSERGARVPSRSPTVRPALSAAEPCQDRPRTLQQRRRRRWQRRISGLGAVSD